MSAPQLKHFWQAKLRQLGHDWDSYGGRPISEAAIEALGNFSVVPTSAGGIQLEAHQDGFDIEIEISPEGRITSVDFEPNPDPTNGVEWVRKCSADLGITPAEFAKAYNDAQPQPEAKKGSVTIIEYLCHACGQHAIDVHTMDEESRRWLCPCGVKWTGGKASGAYVSMPIENRIATLKPR